MLREWQNLGSLCKLQLSLRHVLLGCWDGILLQRGQAWVRLKNGASGKEPTCQCKRHERCGFDPWVEKIPWRRKWQCTPVFLPGKCHGQRSLVGYSPQNHRVGHNWSNLARMQYSLGSAPLLVRMHSKWKQGGALSTGKKMKEQLLANCWEGQVMCIQKCHWIFKSHLALM